MRRKITPLPSNNKGKRYRNGRRVWIPELNDKLKIKARWYTVFQYAYLKFEEINPKMRGKYLSYLSCLRSETKWERLEQPPLEFWLGVAAEPRKHFEPEFEILASGIGLLTLLIVDPMPGLGLVATTKLLLTSRGLEKPKSPGSAMIASSQDT